MHIKDVKNGRQLSEGMLESVSGMLEGISSAGGPFKGIAAVRSTDGKMIALHRLLREPARGGISDPDKVFTKSVVIFQ